MAYLLISVAVLLIAAVIFYLMRRRKPRAPEGPRTYNGVIRFTDPSGRNMKIVRKDDGTFETVEE